MSASQIADLLADGLTRNAVIGKAHRLGLKSRPSPVKVEAEPAKLAKKAGAKPVAVIKTSKAAATQVSKTPAARVAAVKAVEKPEPKTPAAKIAPLKVVAKPTAKPAAKKSSVTKPVVEPKKIELQKTKTTRKAAPVVVMSKAKAQATLAEAEPRKAITKPVSTKYEPGKKITLLDLNEKICKWPSGHPGDDDFQFCGKPVNPGTPYCAEHCAIAYQSQLPRKDRRPPPPPLASRFRV